MVVGRLGLRGLSVQQVVAMENEFQSDSAMRHLQDTEDDLAEESRCQFHQRFMRVFCTKARFWRQNFVQKLRAKKC